MNKNTIFFAFFILFFSLWQVASEAFGGYEECANLSAFLQDHGLQPLETPIIHSDSNNFPFNLSVDFSENTNQINEKSKNYFTQFVIAFTVEDASKNLDIVSNILKKIENAKRNCDVKIVFTYGDDSKFSLKNKRTGTQSFLENLVSKDKTSVLLVRFVQDKKTAITTGGKDEVSPAWLVQLVTDSFFKNDIFYEIKGDYINSLYRLGFLKTTERLDEFLSEEIPSALVELNIEDAVRSKNGGDVVKFFETLVESYNVEKTENWDRHANQFTILGRTFWLNETVTTILFLMVTFFGLFAFSEFSFFMNHTKKNIKKEVLRLIYIVPVTVFVTTVSFFLGQFVSAFFHKFFNINDFSQIAIKLSSAFIVISLVFLLALKIQKDVFSRAYSYYVTISGIINIVLFSCIDISLFYVFAIEYIIIFLSRRTTRTYAISLSFIFLFLPLVPYAVQLVRYTNSHFWETVTNASVFANVAIAFGFLPFELLWMRILARLNQKWKSADLNTKRFVKQNILAVAGAVAIFAVVLAVMTAIIPEKYKITEEKEIAITDDANSDEISIFYEDKTYFGETTRILTVETENQAESCNIFVIGNDDVPILSSNSLYDTVGKTNEFLLTVFPPKLMQFSYIANDKTNSTIQVEAIFKDGEEYRRVWKKARVK